MSSANVIVPPALSSLINEREKVWSEFDRGQGLAGALNQLSKQIPDGAPAALQLQFGADSIPTAELEAVIPMVKEKIDAGNRLKAEVKSCYDEIEGIKRKQKTVVLSLAIGGAVVLLIFIIALIAIVSNASS